MSVDALSANSKESWKMILDPQKNPDPLQRRLADLSRAYRHSSLKISSKSVNNFLKYFAHRHTDHYENITSFVEEAKIDITITTEKVSNSLIHVYHEPWVAAEKV